MKYQLVVELKINNKVEKVSLSSGTLEGLLKYTAYCNNTCELIKFLPHDEDFSAREYIEKYLNKKNDKDYNPFSIRKKENINSRKIDILYKNDLDILLVNAVDLKNLIDENYSLSINDISSNNIPLKTDEFLEKIYNKFKNYSFVNAKNLLIEKNLDPDKMYDSRYEILKKKPHLSLALDDNCKMAFVKFIMKDELRKIEFSKMLKEDLNRKLLILSSNEFNERYEKLCKKAQLNKCSSNRIRDNIRCNIKTFFKEEKKSPLKVKPYTITDDEILKYNKLRKDNKKDYEPDIELLERINDLKHNLNDLSKKREKEELKLNNISFLETKEDIENNIKNIDDEISDIKIRLISLEYDCYLLHQNDNTYSDAGFIIDKRI